MSTYILLKEQHRTPSPLDVESAVWRKRGQIYSGDI